MRYLGNFCQITAVIYAANLNMKVSVFFTHPDYSEPNFTLHFVFCSSSQLYYGIVNVEEMVWKLIRITNYVTMKDLILA